MLWDTNGLSRPAFLQYAMVFAGAHCKLQKDRHGPVFPLRMVLAGGRWHGRC
jgi:hypothetical protein